MQIDFYKYRSTKCNCFELHKFIRYVNTIKKFFDQFFILCYQNVVQIQNSHEKCRLFRIFKYIELHHSYSFDLVRAVCAFCKNAPKKLKRDSVDRANKNRRNALK